MMRTPIIALRDRREERGQHPGLLLQRFLCENATGEGGNPEEKRAILKAAINAASHPEVLDLYRCAFDRWKASLPIEPSPIELITQGRLIVGLGSENVLETGIRLHHTYGMPIIPGSALKGLAAHYCDQAWGPSDEKYRKNGLYHQLLFGKTDDSGCIVYHDAWFVPGPEKEPLKLDVMTPHHSGWNNVEKPEPPTDFDSPIPVPFLSVAGKFLISVAWHGPEHKEAIGWTNLCLEMLRNALFEWGVGGKTSSGYGRLIEATASDHEIIYPKVYTDGSVEVTILEFMPKSGPNAFRVKEDGMAMGMLIRGNPPNPLPEIGSKIRVFREKTSNPSNPTYLWTMPTQSASTKNKARNPKGKR